MKAFTIFMLTLFVGLSLFGRKKLRDPHWHNLNDQRNHEIKQGLDIDELNRQEIERVNEIVPRTLKYRINFFPDEHRQALIDSQKHHPVIGWNGQRRYE